MLADLHCADMGASRNGGSASHDIDFMRIFKQAHFMSHRFNIMKF
jgi:hypothetical protein